MAKVNIENVVVHDNPTAFLNPFQFEITFSCSENLNADLEWQLVYVGSAESESYDQVLDEVVVGPVTEGRHKFMMQAPPPDASKIPTGDAIGATAIFMTCTFKNQEFVRVGFYINNEYPEGCDLRENPPEVPDFTKVRRNVLSSNPRVTRFMIKWGDESVEDGASMSTSGQTQTGFSAPDPPLDGAVVAADNNQENIAPTMEIAGCGGGGGGGAGAVNAVKVEPGVDMEPGVAPLPPEDDEMLMKDANKDSKSAKALDENSMGDMDTA